MLNKREVNDMKNKICLGDIAMVKVYNTVREGTVIMISERGINIKNETGVHFYKWCHVMKIENTLQNQIDDYEKILRFYAEGDHFEYGKDWRHGEFDWVENGNKAEEILKKYQDVNGGRY